MVSRILFPRTHLLSSFYFSFRNFFLPHLFVVFFATLSLNHFFSLEIIISSKHITLSQHLSLHHLPFFFSVAPLAVKIILLSYVFHQTSTEYFLNRFDINTGSRKSYSLWTLLIAHRHDFKITGTTPGRPEGEACISFFIFLFFFFPFFTLSFKQVETNPVLFTELEW